jgi:hypothetical protein
MSLTPENAYKEIIRSVASDLKEAGFKRSGSTFTIEQADNWGVINFQQSKWNRAASKEFIINLGIYSNRIGVFTRPVERPKEYQCHIRARLAPPAKPGRPETWYELDSGTDVGALSAVVRDQVHLEGLPFIRDHLSDENIIRFLQQGSEGTVSPYERFKFLSILIAAKGPSADLSTALQSLRAAASTPFTQQETEQLATRLLGKA